MLGEKPIHIIMIDISYRSFNRVGVIFFFFFFMEHCCGSVFIPMLSQFVGPLIPKTVNHHKQMVMKSKVPKPFVHFYTLVNNSFISTCITQPPLVIWKMHPRMS